MDSFLIVSDFNIDQLIVIHNPTLNNYVLLTLLSTTLLPLIQAYYQIPVQTNLVALIRYGQI